MGPMLAWTLAVGIAISAAVVGGIAATGGTGSLAADQALSATAALAGCWIGAEISLRREFGSRR